VSYKYSYSSWWWTWKGPKHVEFINKIDGVYWEYCAPGFMYKTLNTASCISKFCVGSFNSNAILATCFGNLEPSSSQIPHSDHMYFSPNAWIRIFNFWKPNKIVGFHDDVRFRIVVVTVNSKKKCLSRGV